MPGGGSILGMLLSYRENMKLRKKSVYNKDYPLNRETSQRFSSYSKKLVVEEISKQKRDQIKERTIKTVHSRKVRFTLIFISLAVIFTSVTLITLNYVIKKTAEQRRYMQQQIYEKDKTYFDACIENGDTWSNQQQWDMAIKLYEDAVRTFPENYSAKVKLAGAHLSRCLAFEGYSDYTLGLLNNLIVSYPEGKELYELRLQYYLAKGKPELASRDAEKIMLLNQ